MVEESSMTSQFLDLYDIIVNQLIGDTILAIVLILAVVGIILVRNRAPNQIITIILFTVSLILATQFGWNNPLILALLIGSAAIGWRMIRIRRE
jgi:chromate transport protein ChrA